MGIFRERRELKRCSICNGQAQLSNRFGKFYCFCKLCGIRTIRKATIEEAVSDWDNDRLLYPISLSKAQKSMKLFDENRVSKYGCRYCQDATNVDGEPPSARLFCLHKECPYKEKIENYETYEEYFENCKEDFVNPFEEKEASYHLNIGNDHSKYY